MRGVEISKPVGGSGKPRAEREPTCGNVLEHLLGLLAASILVRVVLFAELAIGTLDLRVPGRLFEAQDFVKVASGRGGLGQVDASAQQEQTEEEEEEGARGRPEERAATPSPERGDRHADGGKGEGSEEERSRRSVGGPRTWKGWRGGAMRGERPGRK